jgi:hypothetical protein
MMQKLRLPFLLAVLGSLMLAALLFGLLGSKDAPASLAGVSDNPQQAKGKAEKLEAEILARPLFLPGRHKPEPKAVKPEPPVLQGRLAGVMLRSDTRLALFTRPGGGRPISVKEGDVIDGWTASRIEAGRVVLTSSFGEQIVKPTNGGADEMTPRAKTAKPTKKVSKTPPATPVPGPNQKPQQLAKGPAPTGQK